MQTILHLGRPTKGDPEYYTRWEAAGKVLLPGIGHRHDDITALVVDQHTKAWPLVMPNLKFVLSPTTGQTHVQWVKPPVELITLKGETEFLKGVRSVSEFVVKQMLTLMRDRPEPRLLRGKRLGILGVGRIGKQVWDLATALGMQVEGYDQFTKRPGGLRSLFSWADVISVHVDENPGSIGLVSREMLEAMRPGSVLINTSRPSIVDNGALYGLVACGRLYAAVDFLSPSLSEKAKLPGLLVTEHVAGTTLEDRVRTDEFLVRKFLKRLAA